MVTLTLAALAAGWLVLLTAAPLLPPAGSALIYAAASLVCHQLPDRSFHLGAFQLPVCARCLGLYAGAAAGCAAALFDARPSPPPIQRAGAGGGAAARVITVLALVPTAVTVGLEWLGIWYPSNVTRALAGAPAGFVVGLVVARALATVHYGEWAPRRPTASNPPRSSI